MRPLNWFQSGLRSVNHRWFAVPMAIATSVAVGSTALSQVQTPLSSEVVVQGTSGASQASACGYIPGAASQTIRVTESFTALRFRVQASNSTTLLITGPGGRSNCAMAHSQSNGRIEVSGLWEPGTYSVFVGDRAQGGSVPFTLSVVQE
ncbi:MAG: hypothetical protein KME20_04680 [Kaiparowitsia implicata GSE-PSE-MK54-09C]|jgi:hypothetical protein|nr:hypothetical protein [Kaiparowitsia implicata GSE-PSE-MK54-09C]